MSKKIELWEGYEAEVNEQLLDDFDYMAELSDAIKNSDAAEITSMYFALVGGEETYAKAREYIIEKTGHMSIKELAKITDKIGELFPKVGNRAQRRSWQTTK